MQASTKIAVMQRVGNALEYRVVIGFLLGASFGAKGYYFAPLEAYNRHENTEGADNMGLAIDKDLETKIRARAEAEGLNVEAYLRRLVQTDQESVKEQETLALEGLRSGAPFEVGPSYWQEKHRLLDERLSKKNSR
jgi:hypothetical protein